VTARPWLAISVAAAACAATAVSRGAGPAGSIACAVVGAALAQAVRAFVGSSLAAEVLAIAAALLGVLGSLALAPAEPVRAGLAAAAALWAIGELVRPLPARGAPVPALALAAFASALDPAFVALVPLAGARLAAWPGHARWAIAVPIAGGLACALAFSSAIARGGALASLWLVWAGRGAHEAGLARGLALAGDALGPIVAVAALAGLAASAARGWLAASALVVVAIGALAVTARTGVLAPALTVVAALAAAVGFARLAALVRHPTGQAAIAAACAFVALVVSVASLL